MLRKDFVYFEKLPNCNRLPEKEYKNAALNLGRVCLDVGLIVDNKLILVERSIEPAKGLWLAGGRIQWEQFENIFQYASLTIQEHFGVAVQRRYMVQLESRFICLSKRPYPEISLWVIATIPQETFKKAKLNLTEQSNFLTFSNRTELLSYLKKIKATKKHTQIFFDLWSELVARKLLISKCV